MEEDGSEMDMENEGQSSVDSVESRWVFQDEEEEYEEEIGTGEDGIPQTGLDSDDDDNVEQRLIRTGPRIDSFDVEALEVPGAQRNDFEVTIYFCDRVKRR